MSPAQKRANQGHSLSHGSHSTGKEQTSQSQLHWGLFPRDFSPTLQERGWLPWLLANHTAASLPRSVGEQPISLPSSVAFP